MVAGRQSPVNSPLTHRPDLLPLTAPIRFGTVQPRGCCFPTPNTNHAQCIGKGCAMSNPTKERAITRVLQTLQCHFNVVSSRFGTLGGAGYELAVWERLGVPLDNCWLIERDQSRARRLIARARAAHHFVGHLRDFPAAFRSVHPGGTLDVFHWDLCETVEPNARELRAVFPLIAGSVSRCLLVTCADQRRNRALEEADITDAWWTWLLGGAHEFLTLRQILEAQSDAAHRRGLTDAEAANAVTRELSVYLHLLLVMCDFRYEDEAVTRGKAMGLAALDRTRVAAGRRRSIDIAGAFPRGREPMVTFLPDQLVRFVYYSRADTALRPGFRMLTLGMHLARLDQPISIREAAKALVGLVKSIPLKMVIPGGRSGIHTVSVPARRRFPQPTTQEDRTMAEADDDRGAARDAVPVAGRNSYGVLAAQVDVSGVELARRLRALGHDPGAVTALSRKAMNALGGLESIAALVRSAEEATHVQDRLRETLATVAGNGTAAPAAAPSAMDASSTTSAPAVAPAAAPAANGSGSSSAMTGERRDALRLRLVRARANGDAAYAAEKTAIAAETSLTARPIAGLIATTSGKFEPNFLRRVLEAASRGDSRQALGQELVALGFGKRGDARRVLARYRDQQSQ